jgi:hypothetical protein
MTKTLAYIRARVSHGTTLITNNYFYLYLLAYNVAYSGYTYFIFLSISTQKLPSIYSYLRSLQPMTSFLF